MQIVRKATAAPAEDDALDYVMSRRDGRPLGDVIEPAGWDLPQFRAHPIALFNHGKQDPLPIGTWTQRAGREGAASRQAQLRRARHFAADRRDACRCSSRASCARRASASSRSRRAAAEQEPAAGLQAPATRRVLARDHSGQRERAADREEPQHFRRHVELRLWRACQRGRGDRAAASSASPPALLQPRRAGTNDHLRKRIEDAQNDIASRTRTRSSAILRRGRARSRTRRRTQQPHRGEAARARQAEAHGSHAGAQDHGSRARSNGRDGAGRRAPAVQRAEEGDQGARSLRAQVGRSSSSRSSRTKIRSRSSSGAIPTARARITSSPARLWRAPRRPRRDGRPSSCRPATPNGSKRCGRSRSSRRWRRRGRAWPSVANQGIIRIPSRAATPSIAGSFVGEGAPIPVRRLGLTSITLSPKKMAVISVFSREIAQVLQPADRGADQARDRGRYGDHARHAAARCHGGLVGAAGRAAQRRHAADAQRRAAAQPPSSATSISSSRRSTPPMPGATWC